MRRSSLRSNIIPLNRLYSLNYDLSKDKFVNENKGGNTCISVPWKFILIEKKIPLRKQTLSSLARTTDDKETIYSNLIMYSGFQD